MRPLAALMPALTVALGLAGPSDFDRLRQLFHDPPDDARIMMRWWWFGPTVTKVELEREMRLMREGGIGGFEVQPVYPVVLDDETRGFRTTPFLSPEFLETLRFTASTAQALGLRMDLTLGSGWPFGGPGVPVRYAAGRLRHERVPVAGPGRVPLPDLAEGERMIAVFLARVDGDAIQPDSLQPLRDVADGAVRVPAGVTGPHALLVFVSSRTGMMVKRPAVGGEGFVLSHFDRAATDHYLRTVGDLLLGPPGTPRPTAVFCDSLEVYGSDWADDLLEAFRAKRGYDLLPHLPALIADLGPSSRDIRYDWGRTLTELLNERFLAPLGDWSRRQGTRLRAQAYGVPAAALSGNVHVDVPEGEGAQWKTLSATRWASSAAHLFSRPVASSETWTWLHSPAFRATPLDLKAEADRHFLQGITQLVGHGWPYTAEGAEYPGWRFYAAGVFNDKNPWWPVMPDVARYLQRLSFVLRQGRPVADVAVYLPTADAYADFSAGRVHLIELLRARVGRDLERILDAGYTFDLVDDEVLAARGEIANGVLALGDGRYRAVLLPGVERMPRQTIETLERFARSGGLVVATRRLPESAPGLRTSDGDRHAVGALARRLFSDPGAPGVVAADDPLGVAGALAPRLGPDVRLMPASPDIGFVHRAVEGTDVYFIANTSNARHRVAATFRVGVRRADSWDPMTGSSAPANASRGPDGGTMVELDLEPYASRVIVFPSGDARLPAARAKPPARATPSLPLDTGWTVRFGDRAPVPIDRLESWTVSDETRFYSGIGVYETRADVPAGWIRKGARAWLDLGDGTPVAETPRQHGMRAWLDGPVREAAVVHVNGQRAGAVWCPPYRVDVSALLRTGVNAFRIDVGNLAINHLAGQSPPSYRLLNLRYGTRFEPQDMKDLQPVPAGLMGPVRLISIDD